MHADSNFFTRLYLFVYTFIHQQIGALVKTSRAGEYAEAFFRCKLTPPGFNFWGVSICPTVDFWPYVAIYKAYITVIHPVTTALPTSSIYRRNHTKCVRLTTTLINKKLGYRRGTERCGVSIEILPIATQQCRNYLYDKS